MTWYDVMHLLSGGPATGSMRGLPRPWEAPGVSQCVAFPVLGRVTGVAHSPVITSLSSSGFLARKKAANTKAQHKH